MGLFLFKKWQWTCSVLIIFVFLGIPTNNRVFGATLRNYAILNLRSDDLGQIDTEKVFGFSGTGNKHPAAGAVSTYSQTPSHQQQNYNQNLLSQQNHQHLQLQDSQQQHLQQSPNVEIQLTGGTLQTELDQSSLLELGASLMPSLGGSPMQTSTFFASSTPQRPPPSQVSPNSALHQLQYPSQQVPALLQQQNIPPPPPPPQNPNPQIGHASAQHLSSSQLQQPTSQQQFQETQAQTQQSASTEAQQPHLEQPSPSPAPPQELPPVSSQQESHFTPSQLPPSQEEPEHLSSQQLQPPPQVQQLSSHSHQSSSSPSQQQSQQVISQQQHYSKPPPQESVLLEQYQSVVHTEPQSTPEHPQAPFLPPQLAEAVQESPQQAPPQLSEAPQSPPQQTPQLSEEVQVSPPQHAEVAAASTIAEPSIDHEHFESVETSPLEQSSSIPDHLPSTAQEAELAEEQPAAPSGASFLILPQNVINSPLQSSNFGIFNKPQLQEDSQLSNNNQPQDQPFTLLDKPGSLISHLSGGSLLSNSIPSSGQSQHKPDEQAASSDSNEHEQLASPSVLGSTGGWSPADLVSGPTLLMDTSLAISSAAAVSSTHMEALNLIGDHDKPAIAEVQFGSNANHDVVGNTYQVSSGSTEGSQNSEGHIDGGSSQMYELATMGEHNEVLVSGTSGSEAIGSVLQQSLADTIMAEAPVQQLPQQQSPVEMPLIELSSPQPAPEAEVLLHVPQFEPQPQVIQVEPQHIEDIPLEIPQIEPQAIEAPIISQVTVPDPMSAQQSSSSQFNQIAAPHNNLIQGSQQELLQLLLSQQQEDESETIQRPADTNPINEAINMAHSGQNQVQQSSVNQVSNNLIVLQQDSSKAQDEENKLSEKISRALLKQANGLNQIPFVFDEGKIVPEHDGLFAAMLQ